MFGYSLFLRAQSTKCFASNVAMFLSRANIYRIQTCGASKNVGVVKSKGKGMMKEELKGPEVCKDPVKLTSYAVGANIFKQGDDPKLKPFEEYPEWLFQLNLGPPAQLHELKTDTWEYWKRLRKENIWHHNRLHKGKKF
ncbi:39S ribosomal protein L54, mitochondrial [Nematolebias whitei]|uniref:39S ribosomal protein L54, mitochondrial n=1 Tax=Nematolebias whitei TaxID=451745 RepID=UPI00189BF975|nr:39S ribosomal protein L54, mitochondrial [Nematolebias whitei]